MGLDVVVWGWMGFYGSEQDSMGLDVVVWG